jgi:CheY-like chemotaxis protein
MSNFVMLLVEDDSLQREVLSDLLKGEGFEVVECATAEAAELIVASTGKELRALITDHNLAGRMTGLELAEYARSAHPGPNIVLMSETVMAPLPPNTTFLHKPFAPAHLLAAV